MVRALLIDAAKAQDAVLSIPAPLALFAEFGDWSMRFQLIVYVEEALLAERVRSELNFDIMQRMRSAGLRIPYPFPVGNVEKERGPNTSRIADGERMARSIIINMAEAGPICEAGRSIDASRAPKARGAATLSATHHGEHYADNNDDNSYPNKQMSSAHRRRSDAAKPEQSRDERDDNEDERVVDQISRHGRKSPMIGTVGREGCSLTCAINRREGDPVPRRRDELSHYIRDQAGPKARRTAACDPQS